MSRTVRNWVILGSVIGTFGIGACGSSPPEPGEYRVYRIAAGSQTMSEGCQSAGGVETSSDLRISGTFMLFANVDEKTFYLDVGSATLDGTLNDDGDTNDYAFSSTSTVTGFSCSDGTGDQRTATTNLSIDLSVDGQFVSGAMKATTTFLCAGADCGDPIPDCSITTDFVGTEIEDAQLEQRVGDGDSSPIPVPQPGMAPDPDIPPVGTGGSCAPTCNHNECDVGGPLDPMCNPCAAIVCTMANPACCAEGGGGWNLGCVGQADNLCDTTMMFDHCPDLP